MIEVLVEDLAFHASEAIARPVNAFLGATTPLMRRLEVAGGEKLMRQLNVQEPLSVGAAVVTGAGELPAGLLIHAVVSSDEEPVSRQSVRRALTSALQRAESWRIQRLAVVPFGLGAGNLDVEESAGIMLDVIRQHLERASHPSAIAIVVETSDEEAAFSGRLERMSR